MLWDIVYRTPTSIVGRFGLSTPISKTHGILDCILQHPNEPRKKPGVPYFPLSHPGWLINRNPYFMVYEIIPIYNWVV